MERISATRALSTAMPAMAAVPRWMLGAFERLKKTASPTPMAATSPMTRLMSFPVIPSSDQALRACRMERVYSAHAHVRAVEHPSDYHGCVTYVTRISAVGQPAQSHHRRETRDHVLALSTVLKRLLSPSLPGQTTRPCRLTRPRISICEST